MFELGGDWGRLRWSREKAKLIYPTISHHNGMQKAQPMLPGNESFMD